jgi:HEAT repeat protein
MHPINTPDDKTLSWREQQRPMAHASRILRQLANLDDAVADQAMAEALPTADGDTRRVLVAMLLERAQSAGLEGVVRHFHQLEAPAQRLVIAQVGVLDDALRRAADDREVQTRLNVIDIVDRSSRAWLAYLLTSQLHAGDARLHRAAASALLGVVRRHGLATAAPEAEAGAREQLYRAVVEACACFHQHRRRDVLLAAACYAPRFGKPLLKHIADRHGPAYPAMCEVIAQADHPMTARALLGFVAIESTRQAAIRGLESRNAAAHLGPITELAHLLPAAAVLSGVRHVRKPVHLAPRGRNLASLDVACHRRLPRWIAALALDGPTRRQALSELAVQPDAITRLAALRQLMRMADEQADQAVAPMCFDADPAIARTALRHLLRRRWQGLGRMMVKLVSSAHPDLRRIAERQLGPISFERLWRNWPNIAPGTRVAAGRALAKITPEFGRQLAVKMAADEPADRLQAVMMARQIGQENCLEKQLLERVGDADSRVASAAVGALGPLGPTEPVLATLTDALSHGDDRVRSNAIESLQEMQQVASVCESLMALAHESGNRSRATAIKVLMDMPMNQALPALERMLGDDDHAHRVSALWVVERLGVLPVVNRVAQIAQADPEPRVRRRAVRVVRDLAATHLAQRKGSA